MQFCMSCYWWIEWIEYRSTGITLTRYIPGIAVPGVFGGKDRGVMLQSNAYTCFPVLGKEKGAGVARGL